MHIDTRQFPQAPLRIAAGAALIYHAAPFLFTASGHANFAYMLEQVGLPAPGATAFMVALLEVAGGLALIIGFATGAVAALLSFEIATRVLVIGLRGNGFPEPLPGMPPLPGYELNLQYLAEMVAVMIAGPGLYSWDRAHPAGENPAVGVEVTQ